MPSVPLTSLPPIHAPLPEPSDSSERKFRKSPFPLPANERGEWPEGYDMRLLGARARRRRQRVNGEARFAATSAGARLRTRLDTEGAISCASFVASDHVV